MGIPFYLFMLEFIKVEMDLIKSIEKELHVINELMSSKFNKNFGSIFRTNSSPTSFAFDVRR